MEKLQTDILIIGGGAAGVAAAVAAAKDGLQVMVVEKNNFLGGKATAAEVGTVCGLYTNGKNEKAGYIVKGFAREFAEMLRARSKSKPLHNSLGLHYLPYKINSFKTICLQLLQENNVTIFFDAAISSVLMNDKHVSEVEILVAGIPKSISLKAIIDCSGHSIISQLAHLSVIKSDHYQAAAQVFTMSGIQTEGITEAMLGMILMKTLRSAVLANHLPQAFEGLYIVPGSLQFGSVSLKLGIPLAVTHSSNNMAELANCAREMIDTVTAFLTRELAIFQHAQLAHIAPEPGIRVGFRSQGIYVLNEADVLSGRKFADAIANASWPIEEWELDKRVKMRSLPLNDYYQVPSACLQSDSVNNLLFGGRNISATDGAIASARVMGICLQTGFAAGSLAAAIAQNRPIADAIITIQQAQV